ncbi:glucose PTS transporter subunit IIA [Mycoplasma sp. E35C]|uniref:PTS transporter subunit IIABC n=1 Tax=Mycoplasma sp. E35C TaxID=2801918 RepID=UPI0021021509|nr:glucose PTS transporter subunit IIA [Mycoplasma sp. E35C]
MASTSSQLRGQGTKKKRMTFKDFRAKSKEVIGKLSSGLMIPIAVLPIAGLLLGIGSAIDNNVTDQGVKMFAAFLKNGGNFIFGNLPVLFAIAIAVAFSNQSGIAGFTAFVAWLTFNGFQNALIVVPSTNHDITINGDPEVFVKTAQYFNTLYWYKIPIQVLNDNVGIKSLNTSVFGGIIIGALSAWFYNKYHTIQLPKIIGFFNGNRFVPIVTSLAMAPIAILFLMVWPGIGLGLNEIGKGLGLLAAKGNTNSLIFGYIERALVPFGLHHAFYAPLWYSSAGGSISNIVSTGESGVIPLIQAMDPETGQTYVYLINGISKAEAGQKELASNVDQLRNFANWNEVLRALNPDPKLTSDALEGDQKIWFSINSLFAGKWVYLTGQKQAYQLTFKTFGQSTLNIPAAIAGVDGLNAMQLRDAIQSTGLPYKVQNTDTFVAAFPGVNPGQYSQGKYAFMIFGLPAAAVAMVMAAPKDQRKYAASMVLSAGFTSLLTGITEPIEFTFLFLAPWLFWGFHAIMCAISFWLTTLAGGNIGQTFSGGLIDLGIYGFLPDGTGQDVRSWIPIVIGLFYIPIYFFAFYFFIKKFDLKTPGRGGNKLYTKADYKEKLESKQNKATGKVTALQLTSYQLIEAFGGADNITAVNACATKLRVSVKDKKEVDFDRVNALGSVGTYAISDTLVHAVYGGEADLIKSNMLKMLSDGYDDSEIKSVIKSTDEPKVEEPKPTKQEPNTDPEYIDDTPRAALNPTKAEKPAQTPAPTPTPVEKPAPTPTPTATHTPTVTVKPTPAPTPNKWIGPDPVFPIEDEKTKEIDPSMPKASPEVDKEDSEVVEVYSPVKGVVSDLAKLPDPSFAGKMMGDGVSIEPDDEMFYAPVSGKLELAYNTGHAYFFESKGAKVLIHIGIDTVSLNSNNSDTSNLIGFAMFAKSGDQVTYKNSPIVKANLELIKKKELKTSTPVLALTETLANYDIQLVKKPGDKVNVGDILFKLIKKN